MRAWEEILTPADRALNERNLWGARQSFRERPAVLVVDVTRAFVGSKPMPLLEAVNEYSTSCGEVGWEAIAKIRTLIDAARGANVPVIYTKPDDVIRQFASGTTKMENPESQRTPDPRAGDIPEPIAPQPQDLVISKPKASAFFYTP